MSLNVTQCQWQCHDDGQICLILQYCHQYFNSLIFITVDPLSVSRAPVFPQVPRRRASAAARRASARLRVRLAPRTVVEARQVERSQQAASARTSTAGRREALQQRGGAADVRVRREVSLSARRRRVHGDEAGRLGRRLLRLPRVRTLSVRCHLPVRVEAHHRGL